LPNDDKQVRELADTIADIAGTSYVLARLIADGLAARDTVQDPKDRAWRASAGAGLRQVLAQELDRAFPEAAERNRATTLLTAAAVAHGRGIPRRRLRPVVAAALGGTRRDFSDDDVAWLLDQRVGGYLTRDVEDQVTVYRLCHDALREALAAGLNADDYAEVTTALITAFSNELV
jgi:hypothetical protein